MEPPLGGLAPVATTMVFDMVTVSACRCTSACMYRWRLRQRKPDAFSIGVFAMLQEKWQAIDPSMSLAFARSDLTGASIGGKVGKVASTALATAKACDPPERLCLVLPPAGLQALAVGGYDPMDNYIAVGYAEIFDPTAGRWSRVADLPTPRGDLNAQGIGNVAYVMGGVANDGDVPWVGTVEVSSYANRWSIQALGMQARYAPVDGTSNTGHESVTLLCWLRCRRST